MTPNHCAFWGGAVLQLIYHSLEEAEKECARSGHIEVWLTQGQEDERGALMRNSLA